MKSLASKLFFAASIMMMSLTISCKDKPATEVDVDVVDTTTVVEPVTPTTPDTTTIPTDTTATPTP